jgi:hypothetical protein
MINDRWHHFRYPPFVYMHVLPSHASRMVPARCLWRRWAVTWARQRPSSEQAATSTEPPRSVHFL